MEGNPNGGAENCIEYFVAVNGFYDWFCTDKLYIHGCPCSYNTAPVLQLRGLCDNSYIDKYYFPVNKRRSSGSGGHIVYVGNRHSRIEYINNKWTILLATEETVGQSKSLQISYAVGEHSLLISSVVFHIQHSHCIKYHFNFE